MQVRLLGPVDVVVDGEPRPVRGLRRKAILAVRPGLVRGAGESAGRVADAGHSRAGADPAGGR